MHELCQSLYLLIHKELVDVLDSLFHENNTEGWQLLTEVSTQMFATSVKCLLLF